MSAPPHPLLESPLHKQGRGAISTPTSFSLSCPVFFPFSLCTCIHAKLFQSTWSHGPTHYLYWFVDTCYIPDTLMALFCSSQKNEVGIIVLQNSASIETESERYFMHQEQIANE